MIVRRPLSWCTGHVVYGADLHDAWAVLRLPTASYDGRHRKHKLDLIASARDFAHHVGADFKLDRVARWWDPDAYLAEQQAGAAGAHHGPRQDYLCEQYDTLPVHGAGTSAVFVSVSLRQPRASRAEEVSRRLASGPGGLRALWTARREDLGLAPHDELPADRLEADQAAAARLLGRIHPYLPDARAATSREVEWLIRRAWTRGLGEPEVDGLDASPALQIERNGRATLRVDTAHVLRFTDYIGRHGNRLHVVGEQGETWQMGLVASGLPADDEAPSDTLELLFRPAELLPFPVDLALTCAWVPNSRALARAEALISKADEDHRSEASSERGATDEAHDRIGLARDLRTDLRHTRRPELRGVLSVLVAGETPEIVDERAHRTRAAFAEFGCTLRAPVAQQVELFWQHLPAQRARVTGYTRLLTPTQVGAMVPTATHSVGSRRGYLFGFTQSANPAPSRFDPSEASRTNRPAGILVIGESGAGKTMLTGKLATEAALDGARIVDEDPKGDHRWVEQPWLDEHVERITLAPDRALRGLLDPWINAPEELRVTAAHSFLMALFPRGQLPEWETALLRAIQAVHDHDAAPSNTAVLRALHATGDPVATRVAEHLRVHATSGLAQLGFADREHAPRPLGERQITYVLTKHLPLPASTTERRDYNPAETVGEQISHLLSLLVMRLMSEHPDTLKMTLSDEAWVRLKTAQGRDTFDALQRLGRSELLVPVAATQLASDIGVDRDSIANLFGAYAIFHCDGAEARRALELLGLDPADKAMVSRIEALAPGQCLLRDYAARSEFVDVALTETLLARIATNPPGAGQPDDCDA